VRTCYGEDLAHVHAAGFGAFAESVAAYLLTRFQSSSVPIRRIIDIGCGAGVTTRAFSDAGFSVLGVEPSEPLIERARKASPGAEFVQASAYDIALPACEAIVAVGEVLTYHDDLDRADDRVREFFRSAHAALAPGGLLAFDVIATGEPSLTGKSWVSGEDWAVLVQVTEDPSNRSLTREIETFRACSGHPILCACSTRRRFAPGFPNSALPSRCDTRMGTTGCSHDASPLSPNAFKAPSGGRPPSEIGQC